MEQQEREKRQEREDQQESQEAFPCEYCGAATYDDVLKAAKGQAAEAVKAMEKEQDKDKAEERLEDDIQAAQLAITILKVGFAEAVQSVRGGTIFKSLSDWEQSCLANAMHIPPK